MYTIVINKKVYGIIHPEIDRIKEALYELFGDVPIASDDTVMSGEIGGATFDIIKLED